AGAGVSMPPPEHLVRLTRGAAPAPESGGAVPGAPVSEPQLDVSVDTAVDAQIAEDREASGEVDLLEPEGP
ncbi:MAG TPA: hypothetical protein VLL48_11010, partial [Longimicrobiales bacterium]|nr:hypothetical protein [Longimicrobiales bacterium]